MISIEDATQQAKVLAAAADQSPVSTIASMLRTRSGEWAMAAKWATDARDEGETASIVPAGIVEPGCRLWWSGDVVQVLRTMNGGTSFQLAFPGAGAGWENRLGPQSPVVML